MNKTLQPHHEAEHTANFFKEYVKQWPRLYYGILSVFGPVYFGGLSAKGFLSKYPRAGTTLNLGSGAMRIGDDVVNVDITPYKEVDLVADITKLPHADRSVARVVSDQTLEHIVNYAQAVEEIDRVLAPGGFVYVCTPFVYPFHASPNDYQRWTHVGLRNLFPTYTVIEHGPRGGPFSTLTVYLCYLLATLFSFGSRSLYWLIVYGSTFVLFPIRYLDLLADKLPYVEYVAPHVYYVFQKPANNEHV